MRFVMLLLGLVFTHGYANAHEWTPTYPTLSPSYVEGVSKADMLLVNMRNDVKYFELSVFDNDNIGNLRYRYRYQATTG